MHKIIVVDDERLSLENLVNSVDWDEFDFEVAGTFDNGTDALEFIKTADIDAVITDIKMPVMSGIELAEQIYKQYPYIPVILLSGYKEFEYAQKALKYNVLEYLLKPISLADFNKALKSLAKKLNNYTYKSYASDVSSLQLQQAMSDFFIGAINEPEELKNHLNSDGLNIDIYNTPVSIIGIKINNLNDYLINKWHYGKERLYFALNQITSYESMIFIPSKYQYDNIEMVVIPYNISTISELNKLIISAINNIQKQCLDVLNLEINIKINQIKSNIISLDRYAVSDELIDKQTESIIQSIHEGNKDQAIAYSKYIINTYNSDFIYLKKFAEKIVNKFASLTDNHKLSELNINNSNLITSDSIIDIISNASNLLENSNPKENNIIFMAKSYIDEHFKDDIALFDVAQHIFVTPSYLSRCFKNTFGENFVNYLTRIRIECAQEYLLNGKYKVGEICEKVGFHDLRHFYKTFKNYTGYTPKEFRNNHIK